MEVNNKQTRQVLCIAENAKGLYLSETVLKDLQIIPKNFPDNGNPSQLAPTTQLSNNHEKAPCGCLKHTGIPARPTEIPFKPTKANREKLQN